MLSADSIEKLPEKWELGINVKKQNGNIIFMQKLGTQENKDTYTSTFAKSLVSYDIYLKMPGDIIESNADEVNDNKAIWYYPSGKIYAKSEVPFLGFVSRENFVEVVSGLFGGILKNMANYFK